MSNRKIIIIGGGLAGLTNAILLQAAGFEVMLFEKKRYPFHRVCGEYISNEALPFLKSLQIPLSEQNPSQITKLQLTTVSGQVLDSNLPMGGFGLSRYRLDSLLYERAKAIGVQIIFEKVSEVEFKEKKFFEVTAETCVLEASLVIATYGKRSNLDQKLKRDFFYNRSPYLGVKYHIRTDLPSNQIRLDNFPGGYAGICQIEDGIFNLCYLAKSSGLKNMQGLPEMEDRVLKKNHFLKDVLNNCEFITTKPEVINEISFEPKTLVEDHLLFCGDSAGMITPLCGNGMAMAFHSAKILSECIIEFGRRPVLNREGLEQVYQKMWSAAFKQRLRAGRVIQHLFASPLFSEIAVASLRNLPWLNQNIVKKTHGKVF